MGLDEFVDITGYEGKYKVNKKGQIYSDAKKIILKPIVKSTGYAFVNLYNKGKHKSMYIHTIVANTFIGNSFGHVVNHKDLNKLNNNVENLEIVSQKENILHSKLNGKQLRKKGKNNSRSKEVLQFDKNMNFIKQWNCVMDIERELGIKSSNISNCSLGKSKTAKGYIWKYKERSDDLSV